MSAPAPHRFVIARADEIGDGQRRIVEVGGREIGVLNVAGVYYAFLNRCPHAGGPLCRGEVLGLIESDGPGDIRFDSSRKMLTCPWHGWEFALESGQSYFDPRRTRARRYPVDVESGAAIADEPSGESARVKGPYVAETVPISIEDEYLIVTMRPASSGPTSHAADRA